MMKDHINPKWCLYNTSGCSDPRDCETCGWNAKIDNLRRSIPLQERPDGSWGKIIRMEDYCNAGHENDTN